MTADSVVAFGAWLRRRRRSLELTQTDLAGQIGCTPITLRKIEAEERRPSAQLAARLAERLEIAPDQHPAFVRFARGDPWAGRAFAASQPAAAHAPAPHLPAPLTPLIGRAREVARIQRQLRHADCRLLSLLGPAGIGKTRLALQTAARLADTGTFAGGVYFVPLAPVDDPQLFWPAVAQSLGLRETGQPLRDSLVEALRLRPTLLVLDNLEQLLEAVADLPDLLGQCPPLKILATSREPLRIYGEQRYVVPPLALPAAGRQSAPSELKRFAAVALFVARARAVRPSFALAAENAQAVSAICARLDGLPLALELIAARMDRMSAPAIYAELDAAAPWAAPPADQREPPLPLHTDGLRGLPERQRTLHNALEWSFRRLPEAQQHLFARLAVFPGGCTVEAAQAVCDPAGQLKPGVAAGLDGLAEKSLLSHAASASRAPDGAPAGRYGMLLTVQAYARERLHASGDAAAIRQRHAAYYLQLAEGAAAELAGPRQVERLDQLDAEKANLNAALRHALEALEPARALRMCVALFRFWQMRGYLTEGRQWLSQALGCAPDDAVSPVLRARALTNAGSLAGMQGDFKAADQMLSQGLELFRGIDDRRGMMVVQGNLGLAARNQGDFARAAALHEASVALARELGSLPDVAHGLNNLGLVSNARGDLAQAEAYLTEALNLHRQVGNRHDIAATLQALGETRLRLNQIGAAAAAFRECLQLRAELHASPGLPGALAGLAAVTAAQGRLEQAARLVGAVEHLSGERGQPMLSVDRVLYEHALERLRPRQSEPAIAQAWAEGRHQSWEQAVASGLAIGETHGG